MQRLRAIPLRLEQLERKSGIITIDAMGTQRAIAQQIKAAGAEYILALKNGVAGLSYDCLTCDRYEIRFPKDELS